MNNLRDILYFVLKCIKIKCKIFWKLLDFRKFYSNIFLYGILSKIVLYKKNHTISLYYLFIIISLIIYITLKN